jgi:hypothetical protein
MVHKELMNTPEGTVVRDAAKNGLAVVGFIALIIFGVALGIYSARFVPTVVNGIGAAAVYLGQVFTPATNDGTPGISVIPTASSTIHFGDATTTPPAPITTPVTPVQPKPSAPKPAPSYPAKPAIEPGYAPVNYYGLPDLALSNVMAGYVTVNPETHASFMTTFVESNRVPDGYYPAMKFTVKNSGTNVSGTWRVEMSVPGKTESSGELESMAPNQQATYVMAVNDARTGSDQEITITVLAGDEASKKNNSATETLDIK